jgi:hypothetical protein
MPALNFVGAFPYRGVGDPDPKRGGLGRRCTMGQIEGGEMDRAAVGGGS